MNSRYERAQNMEKADLLEGVGGKGPVVGVVAVGGDQNIGQPSGRRAQL